MTSGVTTNGSSKNGRHLWERLNFWGAVAGVVTAIGGFIAIIVDPEKAAAIGTATANIVALIGVVGSVLSKKAGDQKMQALVAAQAPVNQELAEKHQENAEDIASLVRANSELANSNRTMIDTLSEDLKEISSKADQATGNRDALAKLAEDLQDIKSRLPLPSQDR